jgi:signal transduction histidine kinase
MTIAARAYIFLVIALGAAAGIRGFYLWNPHDLLRFYCYLLLAIPASGLKVRLPGVTGTMSVLFVFLLAGIVELGLPETLLMSVVCVVVQSYWHAKARPKPVQVVFSVALLFIASTAGDFVYHYDALPMVRNTAPFRLALLASVFFITNTFPVAAVIALTEDRRLGKVWTEFYSWTFPYYLVGAALVGTFGFANRTLSWQAWVLILPTVYAMYRSYHLYLDRLENQSRRTEEERRHAQQVAELLTQTMAANEALLRANADLEQFAYAASHDLQEPLRMISIYSQLLQRRHYDALGSDGKELLDTLIDGAHRMNQLVADLLSYTRVGDSENVQPAVTNPNEVLEEVQQALMERIISLDAVITSDQLPPVLIHRTHLVQLLQNLVSNSLKYHSPERRPRVHISSAPAAEGMMEIRIQDNGIGIDPQYHERIFGVFKRLHTSSIPGTGIGLAICKKIVQFYGGAIWVESHGRTGSTFHFTLRASDGVVDASVARETTNWGADRRESRAADLPDHGKRAKLANDDPVGNDGRQTPSAESDLKYSGVTHLTRSLANGGSGNNYEGMPLPHPSVRLSHGAGQNISSLLH